MSKIPLWFVVFAVVMPHVFAKDEMPSQLSQVKVSDEIHVLSGPGGNIGVLCNKDGALMVDDKFSNNYKEIVGNVSSLCDAPVKFLLNTHWHYDHTGSNAEFGDAGSIIIAHENVRKRMAKPGFIAFFKRKVDAASKSALPVVTFTRDMKFHFDREAVAVKHYGVGHTDGDAVIYFETSNVIHMGDTYFAGMYPFIDYSSGGQIEGVISVLGKVLSSINDKTVVIPGHGPISNKAELSDYLDMLIGIMTKRDEMLKNGSTKKEIIQANISAPYDATWNTGFIKGEQFVKMILN